MPEQKGRRRKRERRRGDRGQRTGDSGVDDDESSVTAPMVPAQPARLGSAASTQRDRLPSPTSRATGFMIALVTAIIAGGMLYNAATEASGVDTVLRGAAGAALMLLALGVGVLSLAPGAVRSWVRRRG